MNVDMALAFLEFVPERHRIFEKRQAGRPGPWTDDPILASRKFTNVFRVIDHGSQFLLKELLQTAETPADALARAFLYRMTNRPQVWEWHKATSGSYPTVEEMNPALADSWCSWRDLGGQVFSGAYVIMPEPGVLGVDKTRSVIKLAERYFAPESNLHVVARFYEAGSMAERFSILRALPGIGDFLAMQILTDVGYSPYGDDQDENEFVVAGPGARNGAFEIFPEKRAIDVIHWCRERVLALPDCPRLLGYGLREDMTYPSLMSIQNTLCEFSKYARYMRKPPKARPYVAAHSGPQPEPVFAEHWKS